MIRTLSASASRLAILALAGLIAAPGSPATAEGPRRVLYVGNVDQPRGRDHVAFLKGHFPEVEAAARDGFDPASASGFDVVVLDWSQADPGRNDAADGSRFSDSKLASPLGRREAWSRPTVLLGSAGHLLAAPWQTLGGPGCTCLEPFAYRPADHPAFRSPIRVAVDRTVRQDWPTKWWGPAPDGSSTVELLAILADPSRGYTPGWCTYSEDMTGAPEVEILCGGLNAKKPTAAAIWRQGNLMHFGFDLAPSDMTETGRALLVDSIHYIARFTEDRPIARTPSPFAAPAPRSRDVIATVLGRDDLGAHALRYFVPGATIKAEHLDDLATAKAWFARSRDYLRADSEALLVVDEEARAFGTPPAGPAFFDRAIAGLRAGGDGAARSARLLARYAPDGPGEGATADTWQAWIAESRPYLFFSDAGGFRWYVNPLARSRKVPTADLRGPTRADRRQ